VTNPAVEGDSSQHLHRLFICSSLFPLALEARLAVETVSVFGDNGLPDPAAACLAAASAAGPVAFEPPHFYRKRMREVAQRMRADGRLPPKDELPPASVPPKPATR